MHKLGELASIFCNTFSSPGYEVGIYSNLNRWSSCLTDPAFTNPDWHKWAARYPATNMATSSDVPGTEIWQFSDCGHVDGVAGNVDMNFDYVGFGDTREGALEVSSETQAIGREINLRAEQLAKAANSNLFGIRTAGPSGACCVTSPRTHVCGPRPARAPTPPTSTSWTRRAPCPPGRAATTWESVPVLFKASCMLSYLFLLRS